MSRQRSLHLRLEHSLKGIARIEQRTVGRTVEDYLADEGLREMIERNIARISVVSQFEYVPSGAGARIRRPPVPY